MRKKGLGFRLESYNGDSIFWDIYFEDGELKEVLDVWLHDKKLGSVGSKSFSDMRVLDILNMRDRIIVSVKVSCSCSRITEMMRSSILSGLQKDT
jgi:hypothetical protein